MNLVRALIGTAVLLISAKTSLMGATESKNTTSKMEPLDQEATAHLSLESLMDKLNNHAFQQAHPQLIAHSHEKSQ